MRIIDSTWASEPATAPQPTDNLWLSTMTDIAAQWGWLLALIVVTALISAAFDDYRTDRTR